MFKSILSVLALSAFSVVPASAELVRLGTDQYSALDGNNNTHYITYVRQDYEGDVQVKVSMNGTTVYYWVSCKDDQISEAGDNFDGWRYVDHRKMEGYYSDVACRN